MALLLFLWLLYDYMRDYQQDNLDQKSGGKKVLALLISLLLMVVLNIYYFMKIVKYIISLNFEAGGDFSSVMKFYLESFMTIILLIFSLIFMLYLETFEEDEVPEEENNIPRLQDTDKATKIS